ncbi:MAG: YkgJ family cysteine cluster protein [Pseudomonadales bacterium]|nr:YkgJ family cysteine cluster protein [Pseudomonadales bacterium]
MKECNSCGKCCTVYGSGGLSATQSEIQYWEVFRPDIARYVRGDHIWMNPSDGQQLERCPWLSKHPTADKYLCAIYYDRPDDCKHYPVTIEQMIEDECEMLEVRDLHNLRKAQKDLDKLMIDSRPGFE